MRFEQVLPQGGGQIRLLGVIRGVLGTPKESHANGADIYLAFVADNILQGVRFEDFHIRLLPFFLGRQLAPASATVRQVTVTNKALKPRPPGRVTVARVGTVGTVQVYPSTPGVPGAGDLFPDGATDSGPPFQFEGDFLADVDGGTASPENTDSFTVTLPAATAAVVNVKSRLNNFVSVATSVSVGASDGSYHS